MGAVRVPERGHRSRRWWWWWARGVGARRELDPAKRGVLYRESENLLIEDMPVIPLFCSNIHNLLAANVSGFTQLPYSNFGDQFAGMTVG